MPHKRRDAEKGESYTGRKRARRREREREGGGGSRESHRTSARTVLQSGTQREEEERDGAERRSRTEYCSSN